MQPAAPVKQVPALVITLIHQLDQQYKKPTIPDYKTLANRPRKRIPTLQGPIWTKALEKIGILIDTIRLALRQSINSIRDLISSDIGTLFLHDPTTDELYSHVAHPEAMDIAIPSHLGIAGSCFSERKTINSPAAYTDPRFYSGIDRQTG